MADRYWVGGTANWDGTAGTKWATASGGTGGASVPTTADDVFFTNLSTGTCTIASGNTGAKSINYTGFTGTIAGNSSIIVAGSITLDAGMTYTHTGTVNIQGTGTLTTAGKSFSAVTVNNSASTVTLGDALNISTRAFTVQTGTFNTANYSVSVGSFLSNNSNTRTITLGSSTINIANNAGINFTTSTNLTFNAGTSQINFSSANPTLQGGGQTFYNVSFTNTTAGTRAISGANTFNQISSVSTVAHTITFAANQTIGTWLITGSSGNLVTTRSNTAGTRRTITLTNVTSGIDYLSVTDIGITDANKFYVGANSTDGGNNLNVYFTATPTSSLSASVTGIATVTVLANKILIGSGSIDANAAFTVLAGKLNNANASVNGIATFSANGYKEAIASGSVTATATFNTLGGYLLDAAGAVTANATASCFAYRILFNTAIIDSTATVTSDANVNYSGQGNVYCEGYASSLAYVTYSANGNVISNSIIVAKGRIVGEGWNQTTYNDNTWTESPQPDNTWTEVPTGSNTWLRQG